MDGSKEEPYDVVVHIHGGRVFSYKSDEEVKRYRSGGRKMSVLDLMSGDWIEHAKEGLKVSKVVKSQ